jgi:hypothetical protein
MICARENRVSAPETRVCRMMRVPHSVLSSATYTTLRMRVVALPAAPLPVPWMPSQMQLLMS